MNKNPYGNLNKYIGDYDTLRPFLRSIAYGCYHKQYLCRHLGQSARSYEDNLARVRFFLPESCLQSCRQGHREIHSLSSDTYQNNRNYLHQTYQIKSLKARTAFYELCLLQILGNASEPLSENRIRQYELTPVSSEFPPGLCKTTKKARQEPDISTSTLQRYLKQLVAQGLAARHKIQGIACYQLAANPLTDLSPEAVRQLRYAIACYQPIALQSVIGCYLDGTLRRMYQQPLLPLLPCQFKHCRLDRTLDDAVIQCILDCIRQHQYICFDYRGRKHTVIPCRIRTDFLSGRQYLLALANRRLHSRRQAGLQSFLTEQIQNVSPGRNWHIKPALKTAASQHLPVRFLYNSPSQRQNLLWRIQQRFPQAQPYAEDDGHFLCDLTASDLLQLLPWLRTFHPWCEIPATTKESQYLRQKMAQDIQEALRNYEQ